jgi:hypothetical protein
MLVATAVFVFALFSAPSMVDNASLLLSKDGGRSFTILFSVPHLKDV